MAVVRTSVSIAYLTRAVGRYLGYRSSSLTTEEALDVEDIIESGLRAFYWHQYIEEGETVPHIWSFLLKEETITTVSGQSTYTTGNSYRKLSGSVVIFTGSDKGLMSVISEGDMRALHASDDTPRTPEYISALGRVVTVYPVPDGAYIIKHGGISLPDTTDDIPDSPVFSEVVLISCLAAADRMFNKETTANAERFQALLQAAVKYDRQLTDIETEPVWTLDTSDDNLTLNKSQLMRLVGVQMDMPSDIALWSIGQQAKVKEIINGGLRKFYSPAVQPGERFPHEWSFMKPTITMTLVTGKKVYDLPEDFAMMDGPIVYAPTDNYMYSPIFQVGENRLRRDWNIDMGPARPTECAFWVKDYDSNEGTRFEIGFAPTPDSDLDVTLKYKINPIALSAETSLPMGGPQHSQTIVEACLASWEIAMGKKGVHTQEFEQLLYASVQRDKNESTPDYVESSGLYASQYTLSDHIIQPPS